ncbi:MAG: hypothetical protein IJ572_02005 [Bacilli bacterium]|nr:hypothetical protein [Bacilli bacterium]
MANIIGFNISIDNNNIFNYFNINDEIKFNLTINDYTLSFYKENNKYNAVIKENNIDYITLLFNELNDNTIDVDYKNIKQDYYGNIHLSKYDKSNDKSGNLKFSIVTKNNTSSFNLDYKFNSINEIKVIEPIIDADNISEEDIELIENNINLNINDKLLHDYFTNILDLINTY